MIDNGVIGWWAQLYRGNAGVQLLAGLGHILTILYAGYFALRGDRSALRAERRPPPQRDALLRTVGQAHRPVLTGLALALVTGMAQLLAQLDYLPRSPWWWLKMLGLVALLANGRVLQRSAERLRGSAGPREWQRLRSAARRSVFLWSALVLLGLLLTTVRP